MTSGRLLEPPAHLTRAIWSETPGFEAGLDLFEAAWEKRRKPLPAQFQ